MLTLGFLTLGSTTPSLILLLLLSEIVYFLQLPSLRIRTYLCERFEKVIPKKYQNLSLLQQQVPGLNNCWTDWVQYRIRLRLREKDYLHRWVHLICCCKPIMITERYFGSYLSPLFKIWSWMPDLNVLLKSTDVVVSYLTDHKLKFKHKHLLMQMIRQYYPNNDIKSSSS